MRLTMLGSNLGPNTAVSDRVTGAGTVLVPMLNPGVASDTIWLAGILASPDGDRRDPKNYLPGAEPRVVVVSVVEVPGDQPLTTGLVMARSYRALLDFLPSEVELSGTRVRVDRIVKVSRDVASAVREAAEDEGASLVLLPWKGYASHSRKHLYGRTTDAILKTAPCDVGLVRPEGAHASNRVVLPVRGGPAAERALGYALKLAHHLGIGVSVMHNVPNAQPEQEDQVGQAEPATSHIERRGEEPYIVFNEHLKSAEEAYTTSIERILTVGGDPVSALLSELRPGDFVIMGTPTPNINPESEGGKIVSLRISEQKGPPLMLLHTKEQIDLAGYKRRVNSIRVRKTWDDMPFEHWFVENTFHGDEFKDPEAFLEAKKRSGLSISVCLLTSNDAAHIYSSLVGLKRVLQEMHPIADQIAVVDSGSTDGTAEIARKLGAEVYDCSRLLPETGNLHGRGESWWKSLAALKGDILVWLDPRAQRFHPSATMSLAGPLLRVPGLQLVKAYGQARHLPAGDKLTTRRGGSSEYAPVDMSWGGFVLPRLDGEHQARLRVQALRPEDLSALSIDQIAHLPPRTILQVLYPALAGVIEPFSRDMAGRRAAMLSVPAFIGDNLEIGLLMAVSGRYGTRGVGQVELRHAQPAPPPQPGLRTTLDLLQALSRRLPDPKMRSFAAESVERLQRSIEGDNTRPAPGGPGPIFEVRALGPIERPPMRRS